MFIEIAKAGTLFLFSMFLALIFTPVAKKVSINFDLWDNPSRRKIHVQPISRIGGIAIFLAFLLSITAFALYLKETRNFVIVNKQLLAIIIGGSFIFCLGLWDDVSRLSPLMKLSAQFLVSLGVCYLGELWIPKITLPVVKSLHLGWYSFPLTIFWFLLVTNAINLIDGLDGLAAGVCLFSAVVLIIISLIAGNWVIALTLSALAGATAGFLCFNFNPASIFMGDSGSYFLGFMLAGLSILGSIKSQAMVSLLIPVIALGLPLMDTILSFTRRFLIGQNIFNPDRGHIHHKILGLGFSQRSAVLILYGATIFFGCYALLLIYIQNEKTSLFLLLLGMIIILGIRRLGYLEYVTMDKVVGYLYDISDKVGLNKNRRKFLNHQIEIDRAKSLEHLWGLLIEANKHLKIDGVELRLDKNYFGDVISNHVWQRHDLVLRRNGDKALFTINLPLMADNKVYGKMILKKDMLGEYEQGTILQRIELLRRAVIRRLVYFEQNYTLSINNHRVKTQNNTPGREPV